MANHNLAPEHYIVYTVGDVILCYQDILTNTVSGVFEDLKFKISEGSDQN